MKWQMHHVLKITLLTVGVLAVTLCSLPLWQPRWW